MSKLESDLTRFYTDKCVRPWVEVLPPIEHVLPQPVLFKGGGIAFERLYYNIPEEPAEPWRTREVLIREHFFELRQNSRRGNFVVKRPHAYRSRLLVTC